MTTSYDRENLEKMLNLQTETGPSEPDREDAEAATYRDTLSLRSSIVAGYPKKKMRLRADLGNILKIRPHVRAYIHEDDCVGVRNFVVSLRSDEPEIIRTGDTPYWVYEILDDLRKLGSYSVVPNDCVNHIAESFEFRIGFLA